MVHKMLKIRLLNMEFFSESNPMCLVPKHPLWLESVWKASKSDSNGSKRELKRAEEKIKVVDHPIKDQQASSALDTIHRSPRSSGGNSLD